MRKKLHARYKLQFFANWVIFSLIVSARTRNVIRLANIATACNFIHYKSENIFYDSYILFLYTYMHIFIHLYIRARVFFHVTLEKVAIMREYSISEYGTHAA